MRVTLQIPFFFIWVEILALSFLIIMKRQNVYKQSNECKRAKLTEFLEFLMVIYNLSSSISARTSKSALGDSIENLHTKPT